MNRGIFEAADFFQKRQNKKAENTLAAGYCGNHRSESLTPDNAFRVRQEEHPLERCGCEPPTEQILILDTVCAHHLYALFLGPSPFILFTFLFLPFCRLPGCAVFTAVLLAMVPTSGGQKSALTHSPHFQRTGQLHHPGQLLASPCISFPCSETA